MKSQMYQLHVISSILNEIPIGIENQIPLANTRKLIKSNSTLLMSLGIV